MGKESQTHGGTGKVWKIEIREIRGFPHQFSIAWENAAKPIKLGEPRKLVPIFSLTYGQIQISILWYTLLHGQYMVFPIGF